ncbi:hypothetical protein O8H94_001193 [Escherichia coli O157]|nr:hypothetical protein [Escherichia coli O157]EKH6024661.1 hypothetical protein [Escherichia coli O157]EKH6093847.1 hypothetical protein [Escherichia coli O157]
MNKYLAAGLSSADNGLLVLESLTDGINSTPRTTALNGAFLDDLLALKETLHREQQVSRQQLTMLSLSMPEALDGKPLALWTELPSTTGFREARQIVDKAITLMESKLKQEGNGQLVALLQHELERLDNHKEDGETFNAMMVYLSQQLGELHQTLQGVIEHPDVIEDMGYAIQRHADKLAAVWSPALPIIAHSQALATLVQTDTNILQQMLDLQAADADIPMRVENQDISALERFMDGDGCLLPTAPADCPSEWSLKDLLNYIGTGVFAARILRDVCQQYVDVAERVKQVIAKAEGLAQDSTLDGIAQLNLLTQMQCVRIKYQRMFAQSVRAALLFAQTVGQIILDIKDTAVAAKSDDFWDKTQEEIEAADGYTRIDLVQEGFFDPIKKLFDKKGPNPLLDGKASKSWGYLEKIQQQITQTYANKSWVERNIHTEPVVSRRIARALSFDDGKVRMPITTLKEAISAMRSVQKLVEAPAQARHNKLKQLEEKALRRIKAGENQYQVAEDTLAEAKKIKPASTISENSYPKWLGYKYSVFFNTLMLENPITDELPRLNVDDVLETGKFLTNDATKALKEFTTADVFCGTGCDTELWNYDAFGDDDELYEQFYLHSKLNETSATEVYYNYLEAFVNVCSATVEWLARQTDTKALKMEGYTVGGIYTAESAWETLRRTMEYTINILKRLVDWLVKSWRNGNAKAAIQQAEANNSQLTRAKDALLTEGTKKRLASLHSVGIQTIAKYAEAGSVWSSTFKGVTDNLGTVAAIISAEVKELSNGRELDQDKLAKIREGIALAFEKGNFSKVLLGHNGITVDNLTSEIHDYREELKNQFKETTNESIDVDKLIRYNDGCRKFLQGPITDARNKVSGHELDNLLTMLNSMIRQQASSPENKGLGALKNEIVNARDLAKAAVDVLGIAQWLEVRAKRYINALSTIVDKANSEATATNGTLKQESFQLSNYVLNNVNDTDVCAATAGLLAVNSFRTTRQERRLSYHHAIEVARAIFHDQFNNHAAICQHLLGVVPQLNDESSYPWTLGLDLQVSNPDALDDFYSQLANSIEYYRSALITNASDKLVKAIELLDSTALCQAVDPNYEVSYPRDNRANHHLLEYRRLAREALEPHRDFTTKQQQHDWYRTFMHEPSRFVPGAGFTKTPDDMDVELLWHYATLFCAAMNAYLALRYGTDLKVYGWFSEQQNSNNVR